MTNEYYNPSGSPSTGSAGSSATMRSEFTALQAGFALLPTLSGNGALPLFVNAGATALEATALSTARIRLGLGSIATQDANNVTITGGTVKSVSALTTNNVAITGGTIIGLSQLASNNATVTGGTVTGLSQLASNNVAITGGSISTTGNVAFQDSTFTVVGSGDATKKSRFEVDGVTAGATRVVTVPDRDLTIGDLSPITNSLSGDVAINNASNYFTGPTVAQGSAGTWFVSGQVSVLDTAGGVNVAVKLWDGTTVIDSAQQAIIAANNSFVIHLSGYLASPAGNLRISVKTGSTTGLIIFNGSGNSKDSTITAIRIS